MKKIYIDYPDTKLGNTLSGMYSFLTYLSILTVVIGSYYKIGSNEYGYVMLSEFIFSLLFLVDYFVRLCYSKFSRRFILNPFSIADLLSFIPMLVGIFTGNITFVENLTIFRLCRVLRLFRVGKYLEFLKNLWKAVKGNLYKYQIAFTLFFLVWLVGSFTIYGIESGHNTMFQNIPDAMRWAVVTMATVGYGDKYPITLVGRFVASSLIIFGPVFLSIITSITIVTFLDVVKHIKGKTEDYICEQCLAAGNIVSDNYCRVCGKQIIK